jgi:hypothetical protein
MSEAFIPDRAPRDHMGIPGNEAPTRDPFGALRPKLETFSQKNPADVTQEELEMLMEEVDRPDHTLETGLAFAALSALRSNLFTKKSSVPPELSMMNLRNALKLDPPTNAQSKGQAA